MDGTDLCGLITHKGNSSLLWRNPFFKQCCCFVIFTLKSWFLLIFSLCPCDRNYVKITGNTYTCTCILLSVMCWCDIITKAYTKSKETFIIQISLTRMPCLYYCPFCYIWASELPLSERVSGDTSDIDRYDPIRLDLSRLVVPSTHR